jgi:uroporphyrinogen-III synthase
LTAFSPRVLIARAERDALPLADELRSRGLRSIAFAAIRTSAPRDLAPLREAAAHIEGFTDVVFASRAAVDALASAIARAGRVPRDLAGVRVVAVGPATARAAREAGFARVVRPREASGRGVVAAFGAPLRGRRVLLPAAADGRREVEAGLRGAGARVVRVEAYRTILASRLPGLVRRALDSGSVRAIVFASPSGVAAFVRSAGKKRTRSLTASLAAVAIGKTTRAALAQAGFRRLVTSRSTGARALAAAVERALGGRAKGRRSLDPPSLDEISGRS